jgi:hypothetical protein
VGNQFISLSVAEFIDYADKPTLPKMAEAGGELMVKQVALELGKVHVEEICDAQDAMVNKIPQISDLDIPKNLQHAKKSPLWDWWRAACMDELR